jgi:hypothetical protein
MKDYGKKGNTLNIFQLILTSILNPMNNKVNLKAGKHVNFEYLVSKKSRRTAHHGRRKGGLAVARPLK